MQINFLAQKRKALWSWRDGAWERDKGKDQRSGPRVGIFPLRVNPKEEINIHVTLGIPKTFGADALLSGV